MRKYRTVLSIALFFSACILANAQKGSLSIRLDKDTLYQDEVIKIEFVLENLSGNFKAPDFNGFRLVSGPNTSTSISMVNGDVFQKKIYSYLLMPVRTGKLIINIAIVENDNQIISTDPIEVYVLSTDNIKIKRRSGERIFKYDGNNNSDGQDINSSKTKRVIKKI
jgi:hypothetical protein